ncbi:MAG: M20/M25/M40 family metallo-hydrolase, partial [Burkholderiales bacterium]
SAVSEAVHGVTGLTPEVSTTGGTSDGRFITTICAQVVELGPCNTTIHQRNESIAVADVAPLSDIYQGILQRLLPKESRS